MACARAAVTLIWLASALSAAPVSGEAVFKQRCAYCHDSGNPRVPSRDALKRLPVKSILRALDFGVMANVATPLDREARDAVAAFLGTPASGGSAPASAFCADREVKVNAAANSQWNGWSPGVANSRYQPGDVAQLTVDQVRRLKLKWAFGFEGDIVAFAQPAVLDRELFVGSAGGVVRALDARSGCTKWEFQADGPVRSAMRVAPLGSRHALLFGDQIGWFYALEAESGKLRWKKRPEAHESVRLTGAPVVHQGLVFVPVSSWEEPRTLNPGYRCCTYRGSVVAYRLRDGAQVWKTYLIPERPRLRGRNPAGVEEWGPSGASVWSAPTLDEKRGVMYVTTGDNFSAPATSMSDAVVALDLKTGRVMWARQTTPGDVWNSACGAKGNCPGPDHDYGSSAILARLDTGREVLLAGQKSGVVYALDPDRQGEILWQTRVAKGGINGGVQWGMASDGQRVYAATSDVARGGANPNPLDPNPLPLNPREGGGLTALRIATGEPVWFAPPAACGPRPGCSPAQPAAVTAIPGVVFSGSLDGHLRAYSVEDGRVLWDFDTVREYQTVNGVRASGGALNGPGAVVVGGMVYVNSGYARAGGLPGNALLAFAPE
jgi:polyvinyl alcohol dehydrogenase (cytochrome)